MVFKPYHEVAKEAWDKVPIGSTTKLHNNRVTRLAKMVMLTELVPKDVRCQIKLFAFPAPRHFGTFWSATFSLAPADLTRCAIGSASVGFHPAEHEIRVETIQGHFKIGEGRSFYPSKLQGTMALGGITCSKSL